MGIGLERRDEPVGGQGHDPETNEDDAALLADALPDEPGAADLGERCEREQRERLEDDHEPIVAPTGIALDLEPAFKVYSRAMTTYRISDAARRTGLPTSTLRYYERIGLLPAPRRSDAGYRAYEERALDRLSFIARAKALGLGLGEIGELADLWDADRCGPVQARLRDLIAARVVDTQERARALLELSSELSSFANALQAPAPDGPCGDDCGCHPVVGPARSDLGLDLACSLQGDDGSARLAEWQALARAATNRTSIDGGMRLTFAGIDLRALADLVAREQGCCSFLSFTIGVTPAATTLEITGPVDARPLIEALA